jgi:hypothetical protein
MKHNEENTQKLMSTYTEKFSAVGPKSKKKLSTPLQHTQINADPEHNNCRQKRYPILLKKLVCHIK